MASVVLYWAYQALVHALAGRLAAQILGLPAKRIALDSRILLGVAFLGGILQIVSLFHAIDRAVHGAVVGVLCVIGIIGWAKQKNFHWPPKAHFGVSLMSFLVGSFSIVFGLVLLQKTTSPPIIPFDTGLYHAQTVQLIKSYAVVPGIGNLHDRLAFNNSWFLNVAFFSVGPLAEQPFLYQNSFLYLVFMLGLFVRIVRKKRPTMEAAFLLSVFVFSALFPLYLTSISPDTVAWIITSHVLIQLLACRREARLNLPVLLSLSLFSVTAKVSTLPFLLVLLPGLWVAWSNSRNQAYSVVSWILISLFFVGPMIARGYYLSGWPVYPVYRLDLFSPDWKIPRELAVHHLNAVKGWARLPTDDYLLSLAQPVRAWLPAWFRTYSGEGVVRWIVLTLLTVPLWIGPVALRLLRRRTILMLFSLLSAVNIAWFFSAPDPRFAYGSLVGFLAVPTGIMISVFFDGMSRLTGIRPGRTYRSAVLVLLACLVGGLFWSNRLGVEEMVLGRPLPEYPRPVLSAGKNRSGQSFHYVQGSQQCWGAALDCSDSPAGNFRYRGQQFDTGLLPAR